MSSIEEAKVLFEKSKRKLKRAKEAFDDKDYDSALGDAYRCVELTMRALLIARGITRLPKTHGGTATTLRAKSSRNESFPEGSSEENRKAHII